LVDHDTTVADLIPEWNDTAHPHTFAFGGRNLVADPFPRHLPLELGEGQQELLSNVVDRLGMIRRLP
jgi:hypothetical protein